MGWHARGRTGSHRVPDATRVPHRCRVRLFRGVVVTEHIHLPVGSTRHSTAPSWVEPRAHARIRDRSLGGDRVVEAANRKCTTSCYFLSFDEMRLTKGWIELATKVE